MKIEDYNEYYIQGSDHYLIPKDVFMELFNEMINWKEESEKQKEIIDNMINIINQHFKHHPELLTENQIEYELIRKIENILKEVSE